MARSMVVILLGRAVVGRIGQADDLGGQGRIAGNDVFEVGRIGFFLIERVDDLPHHLRHGRQLVDFGHAFLQIRQPFLGVGRSHR